MMQFSAKITDYQQNALLNICDAGLLGRDIVQGGLSMHISKSYYGEKLIERKEAEMLLKKSSIINMVGRDTVDLSLGMGIGSKEGIKKISDVPFLIVFKM